MLKQEIVLRIAFMMHSGENVQSFSPFLRMDGIGPPLTLFQVCHTVNCYWMNIAFTVNSHFSPIIKRLPILYILKEQSNNHHVFHGHRDCMSCIFVNWKMKMQTTISSTGLR